ncbi:hypothetical protein HY968_02320 [Candidatus Kaiserbacteria bacterium]|nr:hypothetical protein [Candidatus Kaiserbacteria bacterium]
MTNSLRKAAAIATMVATSMGTFAFAAPAFAAVNSTHITITTTNRGSIDNTTSARSHTGDNTAGGSTGGTGGQGGDVTSNGSENNGGALGGNGGNGGNGGAGGLVTTGDATATAGTSNDLNNTDTGVDLGDCGCGDINSLTLDVTTDNSRQYPTQNHIDNDTRAKARTGENTADGSTGGAAGNGGVVDGGVGSENNGGAHAGTGGAGGAGGLGGTIGTGAASSTAGTINMLNTSMIRVRI